MEYLVNHLAELVGAAVGVGILIILAQLVRQYNLQNKVGRLVKAAESLFLPEDAQQKTGPEKKAYVIKQIQKLYKGKIDAEWLDVLIQAAVTELWQDEGVMVLQQQVEVEDDITE